MGLLGIYIDGKNQCHIADAAMQGIPKSLVDEYKTYKLCNISFDDLDGQEAVDALEKALKEWEVDEKFNKAIDDALTAEEAAAEKEYKAKAAPIEKQATKEKTDADTASAARVARIRSDTTLNPAQKTQQIQDERKANDAVKKAIEDKKKIDLDGLKKAKGDRIKKFIETQQKKKTPKEISIKCTPDLEICGDKKCELAVLHDVGLDNKPKIIFSNPKITNVAKLSKDHLYFCTCGRK